MAHLHAILWPFDRGLRGRGRGGVGRVATRIGVRGGADDDGLVDLHNRSLDRVGEGACGWGPHVHHHTTLSRWDLLIVFGGGGGG